MIRFALVAASVLMAAATSTSEQVAMPPRLLVTMEELRQTRHEHPPLDKTADPQYPESKFSALMQSPCRPESDGYFGATTGSPVVMRYRFDLEASSFEKIDVALDAINENAMDSIVAGIFPRICDPFRGAAVSDAEAETRVTGFRFSTDSLAMQETCYPSLHSSHGCAVYQGEVGIYGRSMDKATIDSVMGRLLDGIVDAVPLVRSVGVVRLKATEDGLIQVSGPVVIGVTREQYAGASSKMLNPGATFAVVVGSFAFLLGVIVFVYQLAHKNKNKNKRSIKVFSAGRWHHECAKDDTETSNMSTAINDLEDRIYMQDPDDEDRHSDRVGGLSGRRTQRYIDQESHDLLIAACSDEVSALYDGANY